MCRIRTYVGVTPTPLAGEHFKPLSQHSVILYPVERTNVITLSGISAGCSYDLLERVR